MALLPVNKAWVKGGLAKFPPLSAKGPIPAVWPLRLKSPVCVKKPAQVASSLRLWFCELSIVSVVLQLALVLSLVWIFWASKLFFNTVGTLELFGEMPRGVRALLLPSVKLIKVPGQACNNHRGGVPLL